MTTALQSSSDDERVDGGVTEVAPTGRARSQGGDVGGAHDAGRYVAPKRK